MGRASLRQGRGFIASANATSAADIMSGIDRFLNMDTDEPQLLYIWGHSYEFDVDDNWEYMESILKKLAFHDDIFYGTNSQVLL